MKTRAWTPLSLCCLAICCYLAIIFAGTCPAHAQSEASASTSATASRVVLKPCADLQRAEIYTISTVAQPKAVLVLSPGCNGNGEGWIRQAKWREFAQKHGLGLVGLSFASDTELLTSGRGYYYASQGSGQLLLDAIDKIYSDGDSVGSKGKPLPLILFGFSGGAHFTARFTEWKPDRVLAWCSYSAGWWDKPVKADVNPPGLVICGDHDERYGASLIYFKQGRAAGKPWLWLSVAKSGHTITPAAEDFVRAYIEAVLHQHFMDASPSTAAPGKWVDIDQKNEATAETLQSMPSVTGWLPEGELMAKWNQVHEP